MTYTNSLAKIYRRDNPNVTAIVPIESFKNCPVCGHRHGIINCPKCHSKGTK